MISDDDLFPDDSPPPRVVDEEEWADLIRESVKAGHLDPKKAIPSHADALRNWARWTAVLPPLEREVAVSQQLAVMLDQNARELIDAALAEADAARSANGNGGEEKPASVFIDWATFWDRDRSEAEWVYPDVLARGRGHAIYAIHKAGKSLLMLYLAAEIATNNEKCVVIYLDYEMTEADVFDRLDDMGYGPHSTLSRLRYALLPTLPPLDTAAGAVALMEMVDGVQAEWPDHHVVVVIDTVSRAVKGKENDADTFRDFYFHTGIRLKRRGVTWARLDHGGKTAEQGQRGSSSKGDDVDVVWKLGKTQNGVKLHRELARMSWVPEDVVLRLVPDPLRYMRLAGDWPEGTSETATMLDVLDEKRLAAGLVPLTTTRLAQKALKDIGEPTRRTVVCAAVRWRKEQAADSFGKRFPRPGNHEPEDSVPDDSGTTLTFVPENGSGTTGNSTPGQVWEPGGVTSREPPPPDLTIEMGDDLP